LRAFRRLEDEAFSLGFGGLELLDVAFEFADVGADEGVTFPFLRGLALHEGGWQ
jgi:hypothetical protein